MTSKIYYFSLITALCLTFSLLNYSEAGINEVKQSLSKDFVNSKLTNEVKLKSKQPIPKFKPKVNIKLKSELQETNKDYPEFFFKSSEVPYKIVKKTVNGKIQISRFPFVSDNGVSKGKQPQRIGNSSKVAKRIGEKADGLDELTGVEGDFLSAEWEFQEPTITNTMLPNITDNNDARKKEALDILKYISQNLPNYSNPSQKNPNPQMPSISSYCYYLCENYSDYPEICAYARLYQAEAWIQGVQLTLTKYQIESCRIALNRLNESIAIYSSFAKINPDCAAAVQIMQGRAKLLQDCIDKHIKYIGYENKYYYLPRANRHLANLKRIKSEILKPNDDLYSSDNSSISGIHDQTTSYIATILMNIYLMNDASQFETVKTQLDSFYKSIPREIKIKYREDFAENSEVKERTLTVTKTGDNYINVKRYNAYMIVENCEKNENLNIGSYQSQLEEMNQYASTSHDGEEYYTSARADLKAYLSVINSPIETTAVYFCHAEQPVKEDEIYEAKDLFMLEVDTKSDTEASQPLFPFKAKIMSRGSNKEISIVLHKSSLYSKSYCYFFKPSGETGNSEPPLPPPPTLPIIDTASLTKKSKINETKLMLVGKDALKESIASFSTDSLNIKLLDLYLDNEYFIPAGKSSIGKTNILGFVCDFGHGENLTFLNKMMNTANTTISEALIDHFSSKFFKAAGWEFITTDIAGCVINIKNQADWFLVSSHGVFNAVRQGAVSNHDMSVYIPPEELVVNNKSLFSEDLDVLMLAACQCVRLPRVDDGGDPSKIFANGWYKSLPNGVILGYKCSIHQYLDYKILELMKKELNKSSGKALTKQEIVDLWFNINAEAYSIYYGDTNDNQDPNGPTAYRSAAGAVAIVNNKYKYINEAKLNNNTDKLLFYDSVDKKFTKFEEINMPFSF